MEKEIILGLGNSQLLIDKSFIDKSIDKIFYRNYQQYNNISKEQLSKQLDFSNTIKNIQSYKYDDHNNFIVYDLDRDNNNVLDIDINNKLFLNVKHDTINIYRKFIPNKVRTILYKYTPIEKLRKIHNDKVTAIEYCLLFLSNLSNAFYTNNIDKYKSLSTKLIQKQIKNSNGIVRYKEVIKLLIDINIIEVYKRDDKETYIPNKQSKQYRLTNDYRDKGVFLYTFKSETIKKRLEDLSKEKFNKAINNPIAYNTIQLYNQLELPKIDYLLELGLSYSKEKKRDHKGRMFTMMYNKNDKSYWQNPEERIFVEESIEIYKRLTENGFIIPTIGSFGHRVIDSISLMPKWIRNEIKLNGKRIIEYDYSALHPNIANYLYDIQSNTITHDIVKDEINALYQSDYTRNQIKIEHLSFFNKHLRQMRKSILYQYYKNKNINNLINDKQYNHKITTMKLFRIESQIMSLNIQILNDMGIYVGYIYDALFTNRDYGDIVNYVMIETVKRLNINVGL